MNLNTVLLLIVGALLSWGIKKIDDSNTKLVELSTSQSVVADKVKDVGDQVKDLRLQVKDMVLKGDFQSEIQRINRRLEALEKKRP